MTILTGSFVVCILAAGCDFSMGDANATLTNATGQVIRVTGSCVTDDPHTVNPERRATTCTLAPIAGSTTATA